MYTHQSQSANSSYPPSPWCPYAKHCLISLWFLLSFTPCAKSISTTCLLGLKLSETHCIKYKIKQKCIHSMRNRRPEIHSKESTPCQPVSSSTGQQQTLVDDKRTGQGPRGDTTWCRNGTRIEFVREGAHLQKEWLEPEAELWLTSQLSWGSALINFHCVA